MAAITARVISLVTTCGMLVTYAYSSTASADARDEAVYDSCLNEELGGTQTTGEASHNGLADGMESKSMESEQHQKLRIDECAPNLSAKYPHVEAVPERPERPKSQHCSCAYISSKMETSLQDQYRCEVMVDKNNEIVDISEDAESCSLKKLQFVNEILTQQMKSLLSEHEERIQQFIKQSILNIQRSQEQKKLLSSHEEFNDVILKKADSGNLLG